MLRMSSLAPALLAVAVIVGLAAPGPALASYRSLRLERRCGLVHGFLGGAARVDVAADSRRAARRVSCRTAIHVLRVSFARSPYRPPKGWKCFRGPLTGPGPLAAGASCVPSRQFVNPHVGVELVAPRYRAAAPPGPGV
jgi:hypothetical protein